MGRRCDRAGVMKDRSFKFWYSNCSLARVFRRYTSRAISMFYFLINFFDTFFVTKLQKYERNIKRFVLPFENFICMYILYTFVCVFKCKYLEIIETSFFSFASHRHY